MTQFQFWLVEFLDVQKVDITDKCTGRDGTELSIGDVIVQIVRASPREQADIRGQMMRARAKGGNITELLKTYAKVMDKNHKGAV